MFEASAPGSLMLLGEHAVLHNKPAVVLAIDKRVTVRITPRLDQMVHIDSPGYGSWVGELCQLVIAPPFSFVAACLLQFRPYLSVGCEVHISSDFTSQLGLGSSAAVTVATLAALASWCRVDITPVKLIKMARNIIRVVQGGVGSGADVAAAVTGGIIYYKAKPLMVTSLTHITSFPITVLYSGSKTPTPVVIQRVKDYFVDMPEILSYLLNAISVCTHQGYLALQQENYSLLGKIMNAHQGLLESLGVSTPVISQLLNQLRSCSTILGAKISGAGLGDCLIGLGEAQSMDWLQLMVNMDTLGVEYAHE